MDACPWLIPLLVAAAHFGRPVSLWWPSASVLALGAIAAAYAVAGFRTRALFAAACAITFMPQVVGLGIISPAVGALLLLVLNLRTGGWRGSARGKFPASAARIAAVVCICVGVFQLLNAALVASPGTIGWTSLPGQDGGLATVLAVVLLASATNATFEELLWRVGMDRLFPTRTNVIWRSVYVSTLFGVSHVHGTPSGLVGMTFAGLFGLAMCLVRERSRGTVTWIIAAHFVADVILIGGAYGLFTW